jgi:hypothetical protein
MGLLRRFAPRKSSTIIILLYVLVTAGYLLTEYVVTGHKMGVPLDDTWIHFRYAENLANGHFIEYNINEPTPGTTSPLWIVILSLAFLLRIDPIFYSIVLGSIFFLLACMEVYRICLKINFEKTAALAAALLTLLSGRLIWSSLSGMEITLFCYLILLAARIHIDELKDGKLLISTGLILGLACNTRPEGMLFALIYFVLSFFLLDDKKKFLLSLILFLVLIIPYPIFCYVHTGRFLPNTYNAQISGIGFIQTFDFLRETGKLFFRDNAIILILWFVAIARFVYRITHPARRAPLQGGDLLIYLWIILFPLISSFIEPNWRHHGRYLIPVIPFVIIAAVAQAKNLPLRFRWRAQFQKILVSAVFVLTLVSTVVYASALGWNAENINDQQVKLGFWLKENLKDEEAFGLNDIGAIVYITKKRAVDMEGLITPEVFGFRKLNEDKAAEEMMKLLRRNGVNYIVIYPEWFTNIIKSYSNALEKVYSVRLENNTICGGDEMFVFKIHWEKEILKQVQDDKQKVQDDK